MTTLLILLMLLTIIMTISFDLFSISTSNENQLNSKQLYDSHPSNLYNNKVNKHIVMIGDSRMRYQYLSLTYYFTYNEWANQSWLTNEKHSQNWNEFYQKTSEILKFEQCNCWRSEVYEISNIIENRYYRNPINNISVTLMTIYQDEFLVRGHWNVSNTKVIIPEAFDCGSNHCNPDELQPQWAYQINELHLMIKKLNPDYLLINNGWKSAPLTLIQNTFKNILNVTKKHVKIYWKTRLFQKQWIKRKKQMQNEISKNRKIENMIKEQHFNGCNVLDVTALTSLWYKLNLLNECMWNVVHYTIKANNLLNMITLKRMFNITISMEFLCYGNTNDDSIDHIKTPCIA
eukprot:277147_1